MGGCIPLVCTELSLSYVSDSDFSYLRVFHKAFVLTVDTLSVVCLFALMYVLYLLQLHL